MPIKASPKTSSKQTCRKASRDHVLFVGRWSLVARMNHHIRSRRNFVRAANPDRMANAVGLSDEAVLVAFSSTRHS